ncbi:hypothetical protein ABPG72_022810 [Tetrahymena utriculariae]
MAPKKDKSNYVFRFKEDQVLIKKPGDLDGADFAISNCKNCEIYIFDHIAQIFVDDSQNCKVFIGPTKGSVFVRDCQDIELYSSSSQLRISDTKNIKAFVFSQSDPTLENTSGLVLAPYNFLFPGLKQHFEAAGLIASEDKWSQVFDFTPSKDSTKNWTLMDPKDYPGPIIKEIEGVEGDCTNPVPVSKIYGGDNDIQIILGSADDSNQVIDGMASFNIHVTQQQAQQAFEQQVEQVQPEQTANSNFGFDDNQQQQFQNNQPQQGADDFWGGEQQTINTTNQNQVHQQQADDDFWGSQQQTITASNQQADDFWGAPQQSLNTNSTQQQQYGAFQTEKTAKQIKEEELTRKAIEKQDQEQQQKRDRRAAAQRYLQNFLQEKQKQTELKKKLALEEEDILIETRKKEEGKVNNPWEKITKNISLKAGEYPGKYDVATMRQAIVNKRQDSQN